MTASKHGLRASLPLILAVTLIMASLLVIGIGIQAHEYQTDRDKHDACVDAWGNSLVKSLGKRSDANTALRRATKQFNRASKIKGDDGDEIFLVVAGLRAVPPTNTAMDFDRALVRFKVAKAHLEVASRRFARVNRHVNQTTTTHPYRHLECD